MTTTTDREFRRAGYSRSDCNVESGQILRGRRGWMLVTKAGVPIDTDDGQKPWAQSYWARPCTADEITLAERVARVAALQSEMRGLSGPPDDERDRDRIEARREAIRAELATIQKSD